MYTERQAIHDEMHFNRRMIQEYSDRNVDLLKRLRELDERDGVQEMEVEEAPAPKKSEMSSDNTSAIVLEIMKEKKMAKTKEVEEEFFKRTGKRYVNFYHIMGAALKYCPDKLEKRKGGLYVYIGE